MFHQELLDAGFVECDGYYSYDFSVCGMNVEIHNGRLVAEFMSEYDYEGDSHVESFDNVPELMLVFHRWALV